jgi:hypothetical protein
MRYQLPLGGRYDDDFFSVTFENVVDGRQETSIWITVLFSWNWIALESGHDYMDRAPF